MATARKATKRPDVLYLGDWVLHMGAMFVETPFNLVETTDCELHFYGRRLAWTLKWTSKK